MLGVLAQDHVKIVEGLFVEFLCSLVLDLLHVPVFVFGLVRVVEASGIVLLVTNRAVFTVADAKADILAIGQLLSLLITLILAGRQNIVVDL